MYLKILADVKEVEDVNLLSPKNFDKNRELSEMLLISHIYWDLTKIFDLSPHLETEFQRCLFKFIEFTEGNKFQVVNAEMMRRYMRRGSHKHKKDFDDAYHKIYIASKKCYVATHCYGERGMNTRILRVFKRKISTSLWGQLFIDFYYMVSEDFVHFLNRHPTVEKYLTPFILRPVLNQFVNLLKLLAKF
jgi:hypothetical protein